MKIDEIKERLEKMVPEVQTAEEAGILILLLSEVDMVIGNNGD